MSNQPTYDSTSVQLEAFLQANSPLTEKNAFTVLLNGAEYVDYSAHLLRCLRTTINNANFDKINATVFFRRLLRLLKCLVPQKMKPEFMGEKPPPKSEQAKRVRIPALRHALSRTWGKLLEKELPNDLLLEALVALGDDQINKMTDTAQQLGPYITVIFDPPTTSDNPVLRSWSRVVARVLLNVIHSGGLNFDRLYPRLYALIDEDLLTCPYADRFLVDLDVYLASIHVPAGWLSAFSKRLTQLCLFGIAPLAIMPALLAVAGNVLIRHPACRILIDRRENQDESSPATTECGLGGDPFEYHPDDLAGDAANALASSLWELECLECHYQVEIASLACRIRQFVSNKCVDILPNVKNLIETGKQLVYDVDRSVRQYMAAVEMTNARIPILTPLEGWSMSPEDNQANT